MAGLLEGVASLSRPLLSPAFSAWGSPVTWLEIVAFVLSVLMVLANLKVRVIAWPLAIVSSLLYAWLFADSRLYGEASLQIVFVLVSAWGWWQWRAGRADDGQALMVHGLSAKARWLALGATIAAWPMLGLVLQHATDSNVPYFDALPTVGSIAGQILLGRKLVENWPVWVAVNLISIGLFAFKALWLTVLLYIIFTALALAGWQAWRMRLQAPGEGIARA